MNRLAVSGVSFTYRRSFWRSFTGSHRSVIGPIELLLDHGFYALVGPNGSGKTSLMKLLAGILLPDEGRIVVHKGDQKEEHPWIKQYVGYVPQLISVYEQMRVKEYLTYIAKLKLVSDESIHRSITEALKSVRLTEEATRRIEQLSAGQRRRLMIAQALLGPSHILLLDEPFTGLDIEEREQILQLLSSLAADRIIIAAHHLLDMKNPPFRELISMREGRIIDRIAMKEVLRQGTLEDYYFSIQSSANW